MKTHLLVIDPQNDFVSPTGSLSVPGADGDMDRVVSLVERLGDALERIVVTLDAHHVHDISHPHWWRAADGSRPAPFTVVTAADVREGRWTTVPAARGRSLRYLEALEAGDRYPHVVWPEHCLIGDPGGNVWPALSEAIHGWEREHGTEARYVVKGTNPWTEHFSAIRAEVPDPEDPSTQVAPELVQSLEGADRILVVGEARSHCVANTVRDLVASFGDPQSVEKVVLLTDATSDVPGFEAYGERFVRELVAMGMRTGTTGTMF